MKLLDLLWWVAFIVAVTAMVRDMELPRRDEIISHRTATTEPK
jgi:hypothetical protein